MGGHNPIVVVGGGQEKVGILPILRDRDVVKRGDLVQVLEMRLLLVRVTVVGTPRGTDRELVESK